MPGDTTATEVRVRGRVQGVAFRAWTKARAQALGLAGWVRNEADGSVMAVIEGPADAVARMLDAFGKGPPAARVDAVTASPVEVAGLAGFRVLR
ncbi:acylphosphatase [Roseibacterium sp. SDUM158016]|uniref:acylphosphatase n=1 Tax=Roseicyclus sediminis TaxID=2980997 RepID=UPI0021CE36ED|nr:acylphosphatase [Roseibacterium sp. SDUM158016]MCU4655175.1 acylphosphatase [Roseibacterium sp. SDUM158016]